MDILQTFLAYAKDFEKTYVDGDWDRLEKYFADDAVYAVRGVSYACRLEGPRAIFAGIEKSLDGFDRRMDSRQIEVTRPPAVDGDTFDVAWAVNYGLGDAPPLRVEAETTARFEDGRIVELVDHYHSGQEENMRRWFERHAPDLDPSYD